MKKLGYFRLNGSCLNGEPLRLPCCYLAASEKEVVALLVFVSHFSSSCLISLLRLPSLISCSSWRTRSKMSAGIKCQTPFCFLSAPFCRS